MPDETIASHVPLHIHHRWKPINRGVYRFVAAYMLLYAALSLSIVLTFILYELTKRFVLPDEELLKYIVPWVAAHVLRIRGPVTSSLAGDALFQWVEGFVLLVTAMMAAVVWSVFDRRRPDYRVLDRWLRVIVRLALACILFSYGFDKVFPNQFASIRRYDLIQQFGDLNHFSLLWNFMAASKGYTIFSGLLEVAAGVLLLVPACASVGAFLSIVVLSNVVALNLAYNIPVKILSTNLLLMAVYLAAPELPRLFTLLVRNRAVAPQPLIALSTNRRVDRGVKVAQVLLGALCFVTFFFTESRHYTKTQKAAAVRVPMQGIWLVDDFVVSQGQQRSLFTPKLLKNMEIQPGEERWSKLVFEVPDQMAIQTAAGVLDYVRLKLNARGDEALLTDESDPAWKAGFKLQRLGPNALQVQGTVNGVNVTAALHRMDESRFKVRDQGLHLVQPGQ